MDDTALMLRGMECLMASLGEETLRFIQLVKSEGVVSDDNTDFSNDRTTLVQSINKDFYEGRMSYLFYRLIDKCLNEYQFDSQVVYALFKKGKDARVHYNHSLMQELAARWYEKGYSTVESLKSSR